MSNEEYEKFIYENEELEPVSNKVLVVCTIVVLSVLFLGTFSIMSLFF